MMKAILAVTYLLLHCASLKLVTGYPHGPPIEACSTMFPDGHHSPAQTSNPPFHITVSDLCYKDNQTLQVEVVTDAASDSTKYFEGFFIQARSSSPQENTSYGAFSTGGDRKLRTMDCFEKTASALSHCKKDHYVRKAFYWTAPAVHQGDLHFHATIVHEEHTFWIDVKSPTISYSSSCQQNETIIAALKELANRGKSLTERVCDAAEDSANGAGKGRAGVIFLLLAWICSILNAE